MVTRCGRVETRARDRGGRARAFARGDDISPVIPKVTSGTTSGETREGAGRWRRFDRRFEDWDWARRRRRRGETPPSTRRAYSREQREREANSGVETRGRSARDRAFVNERGEGSLGVSRGTWFAGAAERVWRAWAPRRRRRRRRRARRARTTVRSRMNRRHRRETHSRARGRRSRRRPRRRRARVRRPGCRAEPERAATRRHARCRSSRRLLGRPRAVRRRSRSHAGRRCVRSGDARRAAQILTSARRPRRRKMDRNLKVVKGMNSWTRLGC